MAAVFVGLRLSALGTELNSCSFSLVERTLQTLRVFDFEDLRTCFLVAGGYNVL